MVEMGIFRIVGEDSLSVHQHPDTSVLVLGDEGDFVADGLPAVARAGYGFEAVEDIVVAGDAAVGADPDVAVAVLCEAMDEVRGEPEVRSGEDIEALPVVAVEPMIGPDPDKSLRILHDAAHPVVGQSAVGGAESGELVGHRTSRRRSGQWNEAEKGRCRKGFYDGFDGHYICIIMDFRLLFEFRGAGGYMPADAIEVR